MMIWSKLHGDMQQRKRIKSSELNRIYLDTPLAETPHSRRMVTMDHWEYADLIDDSDKVQMLIDPTSSYANA
jgi:hypothetical protein